MTALSDLSNQLEKKDTKKSPKVERKIQYPDNLSIYTREIGLTQADAAYVAEISERTGQRIESGQHYRENLPKVLAQCSACFNQVLRFFSSESDIHSIPTCNY